jgi:hypothetical protein
MTAMKTVIKTSIGRPFLRSSLILIALALGSVALGPRAQAVVPAPDGGYPGGNTAEGQSALLSLTSGGYNTALGFFSLRSDAIGNFNTGIGAGTLLANTGDQNTATGAGALLTNTTGAFNTANGAFALFSNTTGANNTATGVQSLLSNTTGGANTANGFQALVNNTTGSFNTANGVLALFFNTTGDQNTATGFSALGNNTIGIRNTATGDSALNNNTTGEDNTANGFQALPNNTTGSFNIALGLLAGAGITTANNVIAIGTAGSNVSLSCFIGRIRGVTTANADAIPVLIDSAGQLGTASSSRRFKKEIKPMEQASEAILSLKPVTFHYKSDNTNTPQFGLIAEEVAAVNPDLVVRDDKGEIYTVRYDAVNAMLLNEFLKDHRKVEEQQATITQLKSDAAKQEVTISQLKKGMEVFAATLKEQATQIQKVSAQIEGSRPAPRTVLNNH